MSGSHTFELLWWSGCPSHGDAHTLFAEALTDAGEDPQSINRVQMITMEDAEAEGFVGSPTLRIDGVDVDPPSQVVPALTCRIYFTEDGRPGPLPSRVKIDRAIARAAAQ